MKKIGPHFLQNGKCKFTVWAPSVADIALHIIYPENKVIPLRKTGNGYWECKLEAINSNYLYYYRINNSIERPDPASKFQPNGVSGPSRVLAHRDFRWKDKNWHIFDFKKLVIYELHIGTFSSEGTYSGVISKLDYLVDLGVNCIELMPIAQFSGSYNWGYDGAFPFAPHNSYGEPSELKKMVQSCHLKGIAVILDVVYNHLGPEGGCLDIYGPYFSNMNKTPWGKSFNFTENYSEDVKNYFYENALSWLQDYHFDGLRIDAVDYMYEYGAAPFLYELNRKVKKLSKLLGKKKYLIAESDINSHNIVASLNKGGSGFKAKWNNEYHHFNYAILTGERDKYCARYNKMENLVSFLKEGLIYHNCKTGSQKKRKSFASYKPQQIIIYLQNHDLIGNRPNGERLSSLMGIEALKLTSGLMFILPHIPMLFMGEEYAEDVPFLFFADYQNETLLAEIENNRGKEFAKAGWTGIQISSSIQQAFINSKLKWFSEEDKNNSKIFNYYKYLILLKKTHPVLKQHKNIHTYVSCKSTSRILIYKRWWKEKQIVAIMNYSKNPAVICVQLEKGGWSKILDSTDICWAGNGTEIPEAICNAKSQLKLKALSIVIFEKL